MYIYTQTQTQMNLEISVLKGSFIYLSASTRMTLHKKRALRSVYERDHIEAGHYATRVRSSPSSLRTALLSRKTEITCQWSVLSHVIPPHNSGTKDIRYFIETLNIWKYSKGNFAEFRDFVMMAGKIIACAWKDLKA